MPSPDPIATTSDEALATFLFRTHSSKGATIHKFLRWTNPFRELVCQALFARFSKSAGYADRRHRHLGYLPQGASRGSGLDATINRHASAEFDADKLEGANGGMFGKRANGGRLWGMHLGPSRDVGGIKIVVT